MPRQALISRWVVRSEVQYSTAAPRTACVALRNAVVNAGESTRDLRLILPSTPYLAPILRVGRLVFRRFPSRNLLTSSARIPARRRRMVLGRGRSEDFAQDGLQCIGPELVRRGRQVQTVVRHALAQHVSVDRQLFVDVYVTYGLSIRQRRDLAV